MCSCTSPFTTIALCRFICPSRFISNSVSSHRITPCLFLFLKPHRPVVLPKDARDRLATELDKRLDLDIDTVLESPKLRLQLSPAELDKNLLRLYDKISASAGGDVLRVIGGGANVGMQNLYMKQKAQTERRRGRDSMPSLLLSPQLDETDEKERTPAQWVQLAIRRNADGIFKQPGGGNTNGRTKNLTGTDGRRNNSSNKDNGMKMCLGGNIQNLQSQWNDGAFPRYNPSLRIPMGSRCRLTQSLKRGQYYQPLI